ncbi:MAG: hypothetical protein FJ295_21950 [Planctomycetes bacterium]|nr:hypothetical protein [Planctomycetota bacterium]
MLHPLKHSRREFLIASATASTSVLCSRNSIALASADENGKFVLHAWERDARNPIFVPRSDFDSSGAQGPFVVLYDGQWWMFYAGIGKDGLQRICLATANPEKPTEWERHGPILDLGPKDSFDERSATYPCVHRIGGKWHLYYSGKSSRENKFHFSNYWGIGLAQSDDLRHWKKHSSEPVLQGDGVQEYPDCQALVGLGNIIAIPQPDGRMLYRLYYTLLPGLKDPNYLANGTWHVIEHKVCVAAHSWDGIEWSDRQIVLERRRNVPTEDIGVVGLNVWKTKNGYRGIYTGLGTKFKTYALAEAASVDGITWNRGGDHNNVSLTLQPGKWDSGMIGYPCVLPENGFIRLFYNGAGGGGTGVGMAVAAKVEND